MEHDVEVELTARIASLEATIAGFARDVQRRFDGQGEALEDIRRQVHATNGRVDALEKAEAVSLALAEEPFLSATASFGCSSPSWPSDASA